MINSTYIPPEYKILLAAISMLLWLTTACNTNDKQPRFEHAETKQLKSASSIYGPWSIEEIIDSIYKDTLIYNHSSVATNSFYAARIAELVSRINMDGNDSTSLYPEEQYDRVFAKKVSPLWDNGRFETAFGAPSRLTEEQASRLLSLVNAPINFNWGECGTWTPSVQFDFYRKESLVRTLEVGCNFQLRTDYEKVKFGLFNSSASLQLSALLADVQLEEPAD